MIEVKNLVKSYNEEPCLRGVELSVKEGEFVSLMGESGSGKTTLLEILVGVRAPDSGSVRVAGEDICALSSSRLAKLRRTKIGVVYQNFGLIPTLSAAENIGLPMLLQRKKKKQIVERTVEVAKALGVEGMLLKYPHELSGGQQQRIAIARAIGYRPAVLLLDEPTGSLDSENTKRVLELLSKLNREEGTTILQITHSRLAAEYGNRTVRISDGRVQE